MKKKYFKILNFLFLIVLINSKTFAQVRSKVQLISTITQKLDKYYLADRHKIELNENIISLTSIKFNKVEKFNLNTVIIELKEYENGPGSFQLNFKCISGNDCIYSTISNYHNILGIPIAATEEEANSLYKDIIELQNILQKEMTKKNLKM